MSLKITNITLDDFRGYRHLSISDISHNLTIIIGPNAVGKTNIIEAVQLLTAASSFRKPSWSETISWGKDKASASIRMQDGKRILDHKVIMHENSRIYEINDKKRSSSSIRGSLPCVLFIPDDLQLIKASSVKRRDAIDTLALQLSSNYPALKKDYQQVLKQRNLLLKEGVHAGSLFESWDESLSVYGARLCLSRWRLSNRLFAYMQDIYQKIVPEESFSALYIPSWKRLNQDKDLHDYQQETEELSLDDITEILVKTSKEHALQEINRAVSLIGPHKDELAFFINGKNARLFASQGQQRTIVLTMKLAAVELIREILGTEPVLLLDDVMSELDDKHRNALMDFIEIGSQAFITTTNLDYFNEDILKRATIVRVPIEGTRYEY